MTVDTLSYVKRLEAAGVPRAQAEAHAEALRGEVAPQLATKADLDAMADRLDNKIASEVAKLDAKIGSEVSRLESRVESMLLRHTVAINLGVLAAGSFIARFLR